MSRLWLIARREYKRRVLTKGFILLVLSMPLMVAFVFALGTLTDFMRYNGKAVGYVDHSGLLANAIPAPVRFTSPFGKWFERPVALLPFSDEAAARDAVTAGDIQACYVVARDYLQTRRVELVCLKTPGRNATRQFRDFLVTNMLANRSPEIAQRATEGAFLTVRTPDGSREFEDRAPWGPILPLLVIIALFIWFMGSSGSLVGALVEEKENRAIEVMVTSVSPGQLVAGKVLGVGAVGLTQLLAWILCAVLFKWVAGAVPGLEWVRHMRMPAGTLGVYAVVGLPSYVLFAALMTALGATVAEAQESQSVGALLSLAFIAPVWAIQSLVEHPNSPVSVALTLFPLTSLSTLALRTAFEAVPMWQLGLSVAILSVCALAAVYLGARAFRLGMLRYGQRLSWREVFRRARPLAVAGGLRE